MDRFIRRENVKHFRELLKSTKEENERQRILKLLAEEQQKQRDAGDKIEEGVALSWRSTPRAATPLPHRRTA